MKKYFLIAMLLASAPVSAAVTSEQIKTALKNYCVPYPTSTTCQSVWAAHFWSGKSIVGTTIKNDKISNSADRCRCADNENMVYDPEQRKCVVRCPAGYYVEDVTSSGCPGGSYGRTITWGSDPENH